MENSEGLSAATDLMATNVPVDVISGETYILLHVSGLKSSDQVQEDTGQ